MNIDDVIYLLALLFCITAGHWIRRLNDEELRRLACSGLGIAVGLLVSGWQMIHWSVAAILGTICVVSIHPSKCHVVTFGLMFGHLLGSRLCNGFGWSEVSGPTNMIQMILTLKLVGVAFERHAAWKKIRKREETPESLLEIEITDYDIEIQDLGIIDILHYAFNYIGFLTGPYYRYRTYRDYFETNFKLYARSLEFTRMRIIQAVICCTLYLLTNFIWPLSYALSSEFYEERSIWYRLWYIWPVFFIFRMRMYTGLILSECVCTMAGFGSYPDEAESVCGEGPRLQYYHLKRCAEMRSYNFNAITNVRLIDVEKCITFREGMKHWNVCVQYWLAMNVYKTFPYKKFRTAATLFCSAFWHGVRPGHYLCIMGAALYVPLEDNWNTLIRKDARGSKRFGIDIIFWFCKFFFYSYLGLAFVMSNFWDIWRYYSSVYHFGYLLWILLGLGSWFLSTMKWSKPKRH